PTDQTSPDARVHHALEHAAEDVAVAEPIVARTRECRMIRNLILDRQPAKPTIGEVHLHIAAQRSLRADREHVADDQHPDHQFWVNRWPTSTGIIRRQLSTHPRQVEYRSYLANQVIVRNSLFKTKEKNRLPLVVIDPPHHPSPPQRIASKRPNHFARKPSITFATKSARRRHNAAQKIPSPSSRLRTAA